MTVDETRTLEQAQASGERGPVDSAAKRKWPMSRYAPPNPACSASEPGTALLEKISGLTAPAGYAFATIRKTPWLAPLVVLAGLCSWASAGPQEQELKATVLQVADGDTCTLQDGRKVRYLGIDAPEAGDPNGDQARQANHKLTVGKTVRLELGRPPQDEHGRLLAYVFVDQQLVNEELLRQGWAHVRRPIDAKYRQRFFNAQAAARAAKRGIWADMAAADLQIVEIHADAAGPERENLQDEYIVFENKGAKPLNISGWSVSDEANHRYLFPNIQLPPGGRLTLRTGFGRNTQTDVYWGSRSPIWNNDGDTVFVTDAKGRLILAKQY